jgi:hypothetical protein
MLIDHQYLIHKTLGNSYVCVHRITSMEIALITHRANECICCHDMVVLQGSEKCVDVSDLRGYRENQL